MSENESVYVGTATQLAEIVKSAMEKQSVSIEELASTLGVGTLFIKDVLRGQARPEQEVIIKLLLALGIVPLSVPDNSSLGFSHLWDVSVGDLMSNEEPGELIESKEEEFLREATETPEQFFARRKLERPYFL